VFAARACIGGPQLHENTAQFVAHPGCSWDSVHGFESLLWASECSTLRPCTDNANTAPVFTSKDDQLRPYKTIVSTAVCIANDSFRYDMEALDVRVTVR
jgi:hypothetical protein